MFRSSVTVAPDVNKHSQADDSPDAVTPVTPPPTPPENPPRPGDEVSPPPPNERPSEISVPLGVSLDDEVVEWKASVKGSPHLFIIGIPGQGKSWTVTRLLCESARQGLPALTIDFHGQFGSSASEYYRLAKPTVWEATQGLPFSPFDAVSTQDGGTNYWKTNCFAVAEITHVHFDRPACPLFDGG